MWHSKCIDILELSPTPDDAKNLTLHEWKYIYTYIHHVVGNANCVNTN